MPVSSEFLARAADETGFPADTIEKVVRLGELAANVARHPLLGKALVLKGGTALNLCWGPPKRLSVDLDYNFIGAADRAGMLEARPHLERTVEELCRRMGYMVQLSSEAFAGRKFFLSYTSARGDRDRIEVDLNFLFRVPVAGVEERVLWQPRGLNEPVIRVVSLTELSIGKFLALLDRAAPRDAWDVAHLPEATGEVLSSDGFRARFLALSAILDHPPASYSRGRATARLSERSMREQLLPMLVVGTPIDPESIIERAWAVVQPMLQLTPKEEEFFEAIAAGEYRPELLGDAAALELEDHPAIKWKLLNVREHTRRSTR